MAKSGRALLKKELTLYVLSELKALGFVQASPTDEQKKDRQFGWRHPLGLWRLEGDTTSWIFALQFGKYGNAAVQPYFGKIENIRFEEIGNSGLEPGILDYQEHFTICTHRLWLGMFQVKRRFGSELQISDYERTAKKIAAFFPKVRAIIEGRSRGSWHIVRFTP
ncbi:hypothetical protein [Caulobacter hibisci]|uniref:DUF4304 domain-containing protein n=1 Tax=Caulobacter hibisci TaxID=2035993 RepID=A0ABS0T525_9CAUL|nr:hypothetical protein [Caulobacter hibisci]MBI1686975.1 hypothetical protein [Caulobacter hibisci]